MISGRTISTLRRSRENKDPKTSYPRMKIKMTMIQTLCLTQILILMMTMMVRMSSLTLNKMMKINGNQMIDRVSRLMMIHPSPSSNSTSPSVAS